MQLAAGSGGILDSKACLFAQGGYITREHVLRGPMRLNVTVLEPYWWSARQSGRHISQAAMQHAGNSGFSLSLYIYIYI